MGTLQGLGEVMRCVGRRGGGEIKEIHGGGMKRCRRYFQERKPHIWQCVKTVLMRISGGIKA